VPIKSNRILIAIRIEALADSEGAIIFERKGKRIVLYKSKGISTANQGSNEILGGEAT